MSEIRTGTLLLVAGSLTPQAHQRACELARTLGVRLGQAVDFCKLEGGDEPVAAGIRALVASGVQRLVMIPMSAPLEQQQGRISRAIRWASRRWPFLTFHPAVPLTWQEWAGLLQETASDALNAAAVEPAEAGVLLVGAAGREALANADLARLAHLLSEAGNFARVDYAFPGAGKPGITDALARLAREDLRTVVIAPWLRELGDTLDQLAVEVDRAARACNIRAVFAVTATEHPAFFERIVAHHQAAFEDHSLLAPSWDRVLAEIARNASAGGHLPRQEVASQEEAQLRDLDRRIDEVLPPQYRGRYNEVSPTSMGSAPLKFGTDGQVAWDDIWTSFCDLALAGGPCHRKTLLEAVPAAVALAEPVKYQAVVAEIERGIRLVTGLPLVRSTIPGWVGVRCDSEEMAVWLLRAIIVENVMVRRECEVLYLPSGPDFTLPREIKNVVTVVAKTFHYWAAHITARRRATDLGNGEPLVDQMRPARKPVN